VPYTLFQQSSASYGKKFPSHSLPLVGWINGHVSQLRLVDYAAESYESHDHGWSHRIGLGDQD
jgi:hypothetical protein